MAAADLAVTVAISDLPVFKVLAKTAVRAVRELEKHDPAAAEMLTRELEGAVDEACRQMDEERERRLRALLTP